MVELLLAIVHGIIQGVTEWLPVSSTAHILLLDEVWKMNADNPDFFDVFKVVIQLGSIIAVVLLYFHTLNPFSPKKSSAEKHDTWELWLKILIASIPAGVVGLILDDFVDSIERTTMGIVIISAALMFYGVAFIFLEKRRLPSHDKPISSIGEISYRRAFAIGIFQMLALIPGTSRSGSTILGATLIGTSRSVAAEFSFFMAIPVMLGVSGLKVVKYFLLDGLTFTAHEWLLLVTATLVSFAVSLLVIRGLMSFVRKHSFAPFGWYRIILGTVVLAVLLIDPAIAG